MESNKEYIIEDDGTISLLLSELEQNDFIPIENLKQIGDDFFKRLESKMKTKI